MSLAIPLRGDFDARTLRRLAKHSGDAAQTRRLLALAGIYDGTSRAKAAETGGVGTQIIRDWVERFNAKGPDGLINGKAPGQQPILNGTSLHYQAQISPARRPCLQAMFSSACGGKLKLEAGRLRLPGATRT